jgi:hypothetical protein
MSNAWFVWGGKSVLFVLENWEKMMKEWMVSIVFSPFNWKWAYTHIPGLVSINLGPFELNIYW